MGMGGQRFKIKVSVNIELASFTTLLKAGIIRLASLAHELNFLAFLS